MANDMRATYWKNIASASSSRLSSFKDYLAQRDRTPRGAPNAARTLEPPDPAARRQTWKQWAGQKITRGAAGEGAAGASAEKVILFPGWAARRYHALPQDARQGAPYDVDIFVSGYAVKHRAPGLLTRSQKTVLKLAKTFAALPKFAGPPSPSSSHENLSRMSLSKSTEELLASMELPPRPDEMTPELELRALHSSSSRSRNGSSTNLASSSQTSLVPSFTGSFPPAFPDLPPLSDSHPPPAPSGPGSGLQNELQRLHANLESRLTPFWAAALSARTVRIAVHPLAADAHAPPDRTSSSSSSARSDAGSDDGAVRHAAIAVGSATTSADGAFQIRLTIAWEDLCTHPAGVHVAFGDPTREHDFVLRAELLPAPQTQPSTPTGTLAARTPSPPPPPSATAEAVVPLTHSPVRVISDIDDTCKLSHVASGARAVFYNVFVRDLQESLIRGMGDWYGAMWARGVRFHYVSNGPFELLPVITEFFQLARLPPGSIRLRSYGTRTLFTGLLSAPATRKRAGVLDVLASFPAARFLLVGDAGEQDLELYAALARERPAQVLAVFIRDVTPYGEGEPGIQDPTGEAARESGAVAQALAMGALGAGGRSSTGSSSSSGGWGTPRHSESLPTSPTELAPPPPPPPLPLGIGSGGGGGGRSVSGDYFSSRPHPYAPASALPPRTPPPFAQTPSASSSRSSTPPPLPPPRYYAEPAGYGASSPADSLAGAGAAGRASMSEVDKRRYALQVRVWKARAEMPRHVVLRVFREPEECVEAGEILDRLGIGMGMGLGGGGGGGM